MEKINVLIINGDCVTTNTSANLCHLAYINGLVDLDCNVTLLSADGKNFATDKSMAIPEQVKSYTYYGVTLYEKLSSKRKQKIPCYGAEYTLNGGITEDMKEKQKRELDPKGFVV